MSGASTGRRACASCPWRRSTPPGGFPGGCVSERLRAMASGHPHETGVMQCHSTPDDRPKVCVGFAVRVGPESVGFRLAGVMGLLDPVVDDGDLLDTVDEVIERHNTRRGFQCR